MLPVGIAIMVASIVIGIVALTLVALTSSTARSAGRATRTAMYPPGREAAPYYDRAGESAPRYEADAAYQPAEGDAPYYPAEADEPYYPAEADAAYQPAEADEPYYPAEADEPYYPAEADEPYQPAEQETPRYVLDSPPERDGPRAEQDVRDHPAERQAPAYATEPEDAPRWALALMALSGGGLLLGLLIVMIASIP